MNLNYKRKKLLQIGLCNHCLGRQFAQLGTGLENYQRGYIVRNNKDLSKDDFKINNFSSEIKVGGECYLCQGIFNQLDKYTELIINKLADYELADFLVGTRLPQNLKDKEEKLWAKYGQQSAEVLKKEFNRLLAKRLVDRLNISPNLERPDIQILVDIAAENIELLSSSILIYGQYNKYTRDISQTVWNHSDNSIQEIVQAPFIAATRGEESKFHGAGREDLDVRCFGGREFILEIMEPKKRDLNLAQLAKRLNQQQDQIELFNLKYVAPHKKQLIKERKAIKIYKAQVELSSVIIESKLMKLRQLVGKINQQTPSRVKKTRADKVRIRSVYKVWSESITNKKIELIIRAQAGTYIKELISGDQGRTKPSVAQILNCEAVCKKLDVIGIDN